MSQLLSSEIAIERLKRPQKLYVWIRAPVKDYQFHNAFHLGDYKYIQPFWSIVTSTIVRVAYYPIRLKPLFNNIILLLGTEQWGLFFRTIRF